MRTVFKVAVIDEALGDLDRCGRHTLKMIVEGNGNGGEA